MILLDVFAKLLFPSKVAVLFLLVHKRGTCVFPNPLYEKSSDLFRFTPLPFLTAS